MTRPVQRLYPQALTLKLPSPCSAGPSACGLITTAPLDVVQWLLLIAAHSEFVAGHRHKSVPGWRNFMSFEFFDGQPQLSGCCTEIGRPDQVDLSEESAKLIKSSLGAIGICVELRFRAHGKPLPYRISVLLVLALLNFVTFNGIQEEMSIS